MGFPRGSERGYRLTRSRWPLETRHPHPRNLSPRATGGALRHAGVPSQCQFQGPLLSPLPLLPSVSSPSLLLAPLSISLSLALQTGEICLDLLKTSWTGAYTISSTLSAIHQLLSYPDPNSPLNVDVAVLLREGDTVGAEGLVRWCCGEWRWEGR